MLIIFLPFGVPDENAHSLYGTFRSIQEEEKMLASASSRFALFAPLGTTETIVILLASRTNTRTALEPTSEIRRIARTLTS